MAIANRVKALGYRLVKGYYCPIRRRRMAYATVPDNVEDAISVSVWVERLTGDELTLEEAEALRIQLEIAQYNRSVEE